MTTLDATFFSVLLSLLVLGGLMFVAIQHDIDLSYAFGLSIVIGILICICTFKIWPDDERIEYDYARHLLHKPECINKEPENIACINKYTVWIKDSIKLKLGLDSVKTNAFDKLERAKQGK